MTYGYLICFKFKICGVSSWCASLTQWVQSIGEYQHWSDHVNLFTVGLLYNWAQHNKFRKTIFEIFLLKEIALIVVNAVIIILPTHLFFIILSYFSSTHNVPHSLTYSWWHISVLSPWSKEGGRPIMWHECSTINSQLSESEVRLGADSIRERLLR